MTCPGCRDCRNRGYTFCIQCGCDLASLPERCEFCEDSESRGYAYCVGCGREIRAPARDASLLHNIAHGCGIIAMLVVATFMIVGVIALFLRFGETFGNLYGTEMTFFIIFPFIVDLFTTTGIALQAWFVIIAVAAVIAVAYTVFRTAKTARDRSEDVSGTPLYEIGALIGATTAAQMVLFFICALFGQTVDPDLPTEIWKLVFSLLNASVYEELIVRVLLLGLPMLAIAALTRRKNVPLWRYLTGGFGITPFAVVFIVFSSIVFGIGHYDSWGWVKIVPTALSGFAMGYLFVKYGLYASIAMHFAIDYMLAASWIGGDTGTILMGVLVIILICAGAVQAVRYTLHGGRYLRDARSLDFWTGDRKDDEPSEAVEEGL